MSSQTLQVAITATLFLPVLACVTLGIPAWFGFRWRELHVSRVVGSAFVLTMFAAGTALLGVVLRNGTAERFSLGTWFHIGHYEFEWTLLGDELSLSLALFAAMLVGLIGAFSRRYLHREPGFTRFYLLLAVLGAGVQIVVLAGNLDLVFFGWELVGLASALLIAFFHERPKPVEHGLRAFFTYRVCDVGLLAAVVWLHHEAGSVDFVPGTPWSGVPDLESSAVLVGLLLLWASMGKSAQAPLGGWLPRAMEGPTPSSAIFYGAISIHMGPYLLLRAAPLLDREPIVQWAVIGVGALTAIHGSMVGRVQTDIKSVLAYGSMTQVGLIFVEIGAGLRWIALIHIVGHATIRSLEILRSPSLLHDHHDLENAVGRNVPRAGIHLESLFPAPLRRWLYVFSLERFCFDALLVDYVVRPFQWFGRKLDRLDRRLTDSIGGRERDLDRRAPTEGE